ncbi:MAG TPA: AAA family ATPase [Candidatus Eisenbacteria bacterium]|jgi:pilus assembly protein CpaE|nr:AAA family ATPase [Candidatus Eisenbacteria bacterium]
MLTAAIASSDLTSSAQLLAGLEQTGLVSSVTQWTIPADRIPESADQMPDVVFLDLAREPEPFFAFANQLRRTRPTIKLIACSAAVPPQPSMLLEAMRSGVQDFLGKPVQTDSLRDLLLRIATDLNAKEFPSQDKLIVIMGAKGGVGTTTVAVNLGVQLATFARKRTVLLDFARPLGNVHLLLDLHPKFGIRDAVESLDRLDSHFLAGLLTHHKTKLEILGGATQPEEWQSIDVNVLDRVVNVTQNAFDVVLLDMGSQFSVEWATILRMARMILIVAEANVPSLWTLERRLLALKGFGISQERARIIINRWHKGDDEVLKSIQKDINRPIFASLPNDFRKASQAVNLGTPILENHNNILSSRYRQIAGQLVGIDTSVTEKKSPLSGLFSFPTKK